jgi:phage tail sheath gpL-like
MKDDFPSRLLKPKLLMNFRRRMLSPSRTRCQAGCEIVTKAMIRFKEISATERAEQR